jgi:uncharacterized protein
MRSRSRVISSGSLGESALSVRHLGVVKVKDFKAVMSSSIGRSRAWDYKPILIVAKPDFWDREQVRLSCPLRESPHDEAGLPVTPQPLSDAEFDRLSSSLQRYGSKRASDLERLDGFLSALVCGPEEVATREYLAEIWAYDIVREDALAAQPLLQECVSLIRRHRDFILQTLESGNVFTPLLLGKGDGVYTANDWAVGFLFGMDLRKKEWAVLLNDKEHGGSLVPIFALANEHNPDPAMRPYTKPVTAELREKLIIGSAAGVMKIYRYFEARRAGPTYRRIGPKVGRNDLCPCGSGKKFKHCCGKITLH